MRDFTFHTRKLKRIIESKPEYYIWNRNELLEYFKTSFTNRNFHFLLSAQNNYLVFKNRTEKTGHIPRYIFIKKKTLLKKTKLSNDRSKV